MAANKAAAVAAGRALAQGMVVQLQETGQRMVLRLISGCALLFMAASPTSMPSAKCRQTCHRHQAHTYRTWLLLGSPYLKFQVSFVISNRNAVVLHRDVHPLNIFFQRRSAHAAAT